VEDVEDLNIKLVSERAKVREVSRITEGIPLKSLSPVESMETMNRCDASWDCA